MKICINCKIKKPNNSFKLRTDTGKLRNKCRECQNRRSRELRVPTSVHLNILENQKLKQEGKRRCGKCREIKELSIDFAKKQTQCRSCWRIWYLDNKERLLRRNQVNYYLNKYGITREELGKSCSICERGQNLCIDHCHVSGEVRGLLCRPCNSALGLFQDSVKILSKAKEYLCAFK